MRVLFIGNSYTYCNNLPGMLQNLAQAAGKALTAEQVTCGGKDLVWHLNNAPTLEVIAKGGWDYVVLQDHSLGAIEQPEELSRAAGEFNDRIRAVGARLVLYVTWARKNRPEMQDVITEQYRKVGADVGAILAPVGPAWQLALASIPNLNLHTEDQSHPNVLGTYLGACVFYNALFDASPVGLSNQYNLDAHVTVVIDKEVAEALQDAAWTTLKMPILHLQSCRRKQAEHGESLS